MRTGRHFAAVGALAVLGAGSLASLAAAAGAAPRTPAGGAAAVKVGMIYEKTGIYSVYAEEYRQGFEAGLAYATNGTGAVDGQKLDITWDDDADNVTTAVTDFHDLVGDGDKIIGGTVDSGVATQLAPLAAQNKVLYLVGPAAADQLMGANRYTFRSGRQTFQDVKAAESFVKSAGSGKNIVVLAQDYAFGQSYVTDAQQAFGSIGDKVTPLLVPLTTTDFTPTAIQVKQDNPGLIFLAWAGTTGQALAEAMLQQGDFSAAEVVTGLANIATYPFYGPAGAKFDYLSLYFYQASKNAPNEFLVKYMRQHYKAVPDLFTSDGFVGAQMLVRAVSKGGGSDVNAMIKALSGWTFLAPKGEEHIRTDDHALLQPMYQAKLVEHSPTDFTPVLLDTLSLSATAPPISAHFSS
jgi:branched-chain amino acid transport system substrate-binding protein